MEKYFLQSKRVDYCLIKKDDIKHLENLTSDPAVMQYFPGGPQTREQIVQRINEFISYYEEKSLPCFVLFEKISGKCIGRAGFGPLETGEVEVGYILYKEFWGQGFATEILSELLTWAEKNLAIDHIIAFALVGNVGSWRVMEKCGMRYLKNDIAKGVECKFYIKKWSK